MAGDRGSIVYIEGHNGNSAENKHNIIIISSNLLVIMEKHCAFETVMLNSKNTHYLAIIQHKVVLLSILLTIHRL